MPPSLLDQMPAPLQVSFRDQGSGTQVPLSVVSSKMSQSSTCARSSARLAARQAPGT